MEHHDSAGNSWSLFLSHKQKRGGDVAHLLASMAEVLYDQPAWFDMLVEDDLNADAMQNGVRNSQVFVLFLTIPYSSSWFCLLELATALLTEKKMVLLCETDPEREAVAPKDLAEVFEMISRNLNVYCGFENGQDFNSFLPHFQGVFGKRLTGPEVFSKFSTVLYYDRFSPEATARALYPCKQVPRLPHLSGQTAKLQIVCNRKTGWDQAMVLAFMCFKHQVPARVVNSIGEFDVQLPVLVFCTKGLMDNDDDRVRDMLNKTISKVILVFEADGRRIGGLDGDEATFFEGMFDKLEPAKALLFQSKVVSAKAFSKSMRSIVFSNAFVVKVLDEVGLNHPRFEAKQPKLLVPNFGPKADNTAISEWVMAESEGTERFLVIPMQNDLLACIPRDRIVAVVDCVDNEKDTIFSLASQLFMEIPGYFEGIQEEVSGDEYGLEDLCLKILTHPLQTAQGLVSFSKEGKLVVVLRGVRSLNLARVLRLMMDKIPNSLGLVVTTDEEYVRDAFKDESAMLGAEPTTQVRNVVDFEDQKEKWTACILYVHGEGDNAARSVAAEIPGRVWFDCNRHLLVMAQASASILASSVVIAIVTKSFSKNALIKQELALAKKLQKRVVFLRECDPTSFACSSFPLQKDGFVFALRKMGRPRRVLMNNVFESTHLKVVDINIDIAHQSVAGIQLVFTGDEDYVLDSYHDLAASFHNLGVSTCFSVDPNAHLSTMCKALIVYVTRDCLLKPHVASLFHQQQQRSHHIKCVPMWDIDKRREHSIISSTFEPVISMLVEGLPESAEVRRVFNFSSVDILPDAKLPGVSRENFVRSVLRRAELTLTESILPPSYNPYKIAAEKCREFQPGTREWIFTKVTNFLNMKNNSGVFVMLAQAGVGKSVVMAEIARRGNANLGCMMGGEFSRVGGSGNPLFVMHFFRVSEPLERQILIACCSLAQQLSALIPEFMPLSKTVVDKLAPGDLFRKIVIEPCASIPSGQRKIVILLDALDECANSSILVESIRVSWRFRPSWLFLITASRPEDEIAKMTEEFKPFVFQPTAQDNESDLKAYLEPRLLLWGCASSLVVPVFDKIFELSGGVFIWIKFVEARIRNLGLTLGGITPTSVGTIPSGMDNVYLEYFGMLRKRLGNNDELYQNVVALALLTTREFIPERVWQEALLGYESSGTAEGNERFSKQVLEPVSKLLLFADAEGSNERVLKPPHKSMVDWLTLGHFDLGVRAEKRHHYMVGKVLHRIFLEEKGDFKEGGQSFSLQFAVAHVCFHYTQAGELERAFQLFTNFDHLVKIVAAASRDDLGYSRMLDDLSDLSALLSNETERCSRLKFGLSLLQLAKKAVMHDSRQIAGQVLGRSMFPPFDADQKFWARISKEWIKQFCADGRTQLLVPRLFCRSGLNPAGAGLLKILEGHIGPVSSVAMSENSKFIVTACGKSNTSSNSSMCVWDAKSGNLLRQCVPKAVLCVAISPDSRFVVAGCDDSTSSIWEIQTGTLIHEWESHSNSVTCVAWSPDSKFIVTGSRNSSARVWNAEDSWRLIREYLEHTREVVSVAISQESNFIVTGAYDNTAQVWDLSGKRLLEIVHPKQGDWVYSVAISPDSSFIVTGSWDKLARVWDVAEFSGVSSKTRFDLVGHTNHVTSVAVSPDSSLIVSGSWDKTACVWDSQTGLKLRTLEGHTETVLSVAFSFDSNFIVTGSEDKTACKWDAKSGKLVDWDQGHKKAVTCVAASQNLAFFVTGSQDKCARVWDAVSGQELFVLKVGNQSPSVIMCVEVSPDSSFIVTGSYDKIARIWDSKTGELRMNLEGHRGPLTCLSVSSDSAFVVTGCEDDETVRVHNALLGTLVLEIKDVKVTCVAISPDSSFIVTGSEDRIAQVWDAQTGSQKFMLTGHKKAVTNVAVSPDSTFIVTTCESGDFFTWSAASGSRVDKLITDIYSAGLVPCSKQGFVVGTDAFVGVTFDGKEIANTVLKRKGSLIYAPFQNGFLCWEFENN